MPDTPSLPRFTYNITLDQYTLVAGGERVVLPNAMTVAINHLLERLPLACWGPALDSAFKAVQPND